MKRRDILIVLIVLAIAGGAYVTTKLTRAPAQHENATQGIDGATITFEETQLSRLFSQTAYAEDAPETPEPETPAADAPETAEAVEPESYLCIWLGSQYQLVPLVREGVLTLKQSDDMVNEIAVGVNSFHMHSSTCENQDCVQQGEVTLENREERILFNWVVCLPNQVMLELLTAEEAAQMQSDAQDAQANG